VPGDSVADRCRKIGVSRRTYHPWLRGEIQPNQHQGKRVAELTGIRESPGQVYYRAMPDPKPDDVDFHEETTDPLVADLGNFYKVEKWTRGRNEGR
jgi:hypothetical protein